MELIRGNKLTVGAADIMKMTRRKAKEHVTLKDCIDDAIFDFVEKMPESIQFEALGWISNLVMKS